MRILKQGAEAIIIKDGNKIIKDRIKKNYRLKEIDERLRKFRTKREAKLLEKADINVPKVLKLDLGNKKIEMEFIDGRLLKDVLDGLKNRNKVCEQIGEEIAKLHDKDIIHGDITTSNMILKEGKVYFIDFGLGFFSKKIEDRAVDLHLLKQALESKHYKYFKESFEHVLKGYKKSKNYKEVLERLEKVEKRGRYKGKNG
ncbi:MAG: Kae1-associated serine/threonine protein kinase [Nanoarchaeota archaeon]|nr:Kae1-associated serine/threonine protein kinase [Nanoarchaeota archaeon]